MKVKRITIGPHNSLYADAQVSGGAQVYGDARVYMNNWVRGRVHATGENIMTTRLETTSDLDHAVAVCMAFVDSPDIDKRTKTAARLRLRLLAAGASAVGLEVAARAFAYAAVAIPIAKAIPDLEHAARTLRRAAAEGAAK